jgi:secreted trypsin-like serine protease
MRTSLFAFSFLCLLISLGCQKRSDSSQKIARANQDKKSNIINGAFVSDNDLISKHVVLIHNVQEDYVCSGTIIMENLILSAAHCISKPHQTYRIFFSTDAYYLMDHPEKEFIRKASKAVIHDQYITDYSKQPEMNQSDIALFYFEGGLPEGYEPVEVLFDQTELKKNTKIILAGYGVDDVTGFEISYKKSKKFQDKIDSGEVVCDFSFSNEPTCLEITMSGDGFLRKTETEIKYTSESEFFLDEKKTGTCSGDSGGPAFIEKDGVLYLAGVTSRGDLLCNDTGIYTMVPYHLDWILGHH